MIRSYCGISPTSNRKVVLATMNTDDLVLRKDVQDSVHKLRNLLAWATSVSIIEDARKDGALKICIHDIEKNIYYWITMADFDKYKKLVPKYYHHPDEQYYVELKYWTVTKVANFCPLQKSKQDKQDDGSSQLNLGI